jgi:hypothetical protein
MKWYSSIVGILSIVIIMSAQMAVADEPPVESDEAVDEEVASIDAKDTDFPIEEVDEGSRSKGIRDGGLVQSVKIVGDEKCQAILKSKDDTLYNMVVPRDMPHGQLICEILIDAVGSGKPIQIIGDRTRKGDEDENTEDIILLKIKYLSE